VESGCFQIGLPQPIDSRDLVIRMDVAVYLDEQPRGQASEVCDITADRVLSPEFEASGSRAQRLPKDDFRERHCPSEASCTINIGTGSGERPSTMLRMVPLPVPERI
jgi:hypothetical protein